MVERTIPGLDALAVLQAPSLPPTRVQPLIAGLRGRENPLVDFPGGRWWSSRYGRFHGSNLRELLLTVSAWTVQQEVGAPDSHIGSAPPPSFLAWESFNRLQTQTRNQVGKRWSSRHLFSDGVMLRVTGGPRGPFPGPGVMSNSDSLKYGNFLFPALTLQNPKQRSWRQRIPWAVPWLHRSSPGRCTASAQGGQGLRTTSWVPTGPGPPAQCPLAQDPRTTCLLA